MNDLFINVSLVERMLGRKIDWDKTTWTAQERGITDTIVVPLPGNSNDPTPHHATIRLGDSTITSTESEGCNEGAAEVRKNRKQRRSEAVKSRRR